MAFSREHQDRVLSPAEFGQRVAALAQKSQGKYTTQFITTYLEENTPGEMTEEAFRKALNKMFMAAPKTE